jgi:hypothetical protein
MALAMQDLFDLASKGERPSAPDLEHWRERANWRRALRAQEGGQALIAEVEPQLPAMPHDMLLEVAS